jgi:phosphatidylinositol alpha-1,6-mannosyltransferase
MRALVLTTDAFGGHGGIAKYNRDLLTAMCLHRDMREVVVIPRDVAHALEPLPDKLTFVTDGLGSKAKFLAAAAKRMRARESFDLVLCGHINLLAAALAAAWRYRAPLVLWVYGIDVWHRPSSRAAAWACAHLEGYGSISRVTADRFRSWAPLDGKREWIIPNAIELDRFSPGPKNEALLDRYGLRGKTVIATLARLVAVERMKGIDEVLEALPRLLRTRPELAYLVMGDGSDKSRLEQKARTLGVADKVIFTGRILEQEKTEHYRLADVYAMPSRGEGFGFVFLEAMACGVPVVASSRDGGREAVRNGALGILVDPANQDDVVRGIEEALVKPRGVVPAGLDYFAFENFTSRVHAFVDEVMKS